MDDIISVTAAAEILGMSVVAVHKRIASRSIVPLGMIGETYALSRKAIEKLKEDISRERYR